MVNKSKVQDGKHSEFESQINIHNIPRVKQLEPENHLVSKFGI